MLNRLLASLAIVSVVAAVIVAVLWWRAAHGHSDAFHLGANSATQTLIFTQPSIVAVEVQQHGGGTVNGQMKFYPFRSVLGSCFVVPGLWVAIAIRRRLAPRRRPGWELPR